MQTLPQTYTSTGLPSLGTFQGLKFKSTGTIQLEQYILKFSVPSENLQFLCLLYLEPVHAGSVLMFLFVGSHPWDLKWYVIQEEKPLLLHSWQTIFTTISTKYRDHEIYHSVRHFTILGIAGISTPAFKDISSSTLERTNFLSGWGIGIFLNDPI